eukprot:4192461-Prymnesium_polylepis.1
MSESFLLAVAGRSSVSVSATDISTTAVDPLLRTFEPPSDFVFELICDGNEDAPWSDIWINSFAKYGLDLPPPPLQDEWHPCATVSQQDHYHPAVRAVWAEDLASVRQHFRKPRDLLRWRENEFICGNVVGFTLYESVLHLAFGTLNLDVLKHLFHIAPLAFMQLMGMTNTEEHMGEGATLPLL